MAFLIYTLHYSVVVTPNNKKLIIFYALQLLSTYLLLNSLFYPYFYALKNTNCEEY
jgi:hypothetical protein